MQMIEENFMTKITLEEFAKSCKLSTNYFFADIFKEIVGQTAFEYITEYSIKAACESFPQTAKKSVTNVCFFRAVLTI
ncbi:MAG: hypothetical protein L6V93_05655 [Clostridiales bacterium]|nr:MAG: hypothetical protein L6V93_05655 [Clostridiales bacterium]